MSNVGFIQVVLLSFLCVSVLLFYRRDFFRNTIAKNNSWILIWLFLTVFCTWFSWGHDYWHYRELLNSQSHVEQIYLDLFSLLNENYILWRFVVWGLSSMFVILTFKNINTTPGLATILFIMLPLLQFYCVTRNALSLSVLFYALSWLNYRTVKGWIFMILLLALSYNMHQSMPLYLFLFVFVCIVPFNRITLIISLILFPFVKSGILSLSETFISVFANDHFEETGLSYIGEKNDMMYTTLGWIHQIFQMCPVILIMAYSIRENVFKKDTAENNGDNKYLFFAYILIYMSFLFWGEASKHLRTRFWDASYLPLCYFLSQFLCLKRKNLVVRLFFSLLLISFLWRLLYNIYSF